MLTLYPTLEFIIGITGKMLVNTKVSAREKEVLKIMPLQKGEVYRCADENCGCEITVTKGAPPTCGGNESPRCCCGKAMTKVSE